MRPNGRDHGNCVDLGRQKHLGKVGRDRHVRIGPPRAHERGLVLVTHDYDFAVVDAVEVSHDVRTPIAVADDADANHVGPSGRSRIICRGAHCTEFWRADRCVQNGRVITRHSGLPGSGSIDRRIRAGLPATMAPSGTSRVTMLPAPTMARSPITTFDRIVAPEPIDAPFLTSVGSTFQSLPVCSSPVAVVARGYESLMNVTLCPMKT